MKMKCRTPRNLEIYQKRDNINCKKMYPLYKDYLTFLKHCRRKSVIAGDKLSGMGG